MVERDDENGWTTIQAKGMPACSSVDSIPRVTNSGHFCVIFLPVVLGGQSRRQVRLPVKPVGD